MKKFQIKIVMILLMFPLLLFAQEEVEYPKKIDQTGFRAVLVQTGDVYISGQPDKEALKRMKELGVTTVVNLRTDMEMDNRNFVPYDEKAFIDSLGLKYVHIPQGGEDTPYGPEALDKFAEAVNEAEGKVLLHCTVAWRASHLWAAHLIRYKGFELDEAIRHAKAINFGTLPVEEFLGGKIKWIIERDIEEDVN